MTLLRRYDDENKQVEIEAKFLEVHKVTLEELGFDWSVNYRANPTLLLRICSQFKDSNRGMAIVDSDTAFISNTRSLSQAFSLLVMIPKLQLLARAKTHKSSIILLQRFPTL